LSVAMAWKGRRQRRRSKADRMTPARPTIGSASTLESAIATVMSDNRLGRAYAQGSFALAGRSVPSLHLSIEHLNELALLTKESPRICIRPPTEEWNCLKDLDPDKRSFGRRSD